MLQIIKGEGINIEFKSTLRSFQDSENSKYQTIKFGPKTKFNDTNQTHFKRSIELAIAYTLYPIICHIIYNFIYHIS